MRIQRIGTLLVLGAVGLSAAASAQEKKEGISLKGDARYRLELDSETGVPNELVNKVRARLGVAGVVNDSVNAGVQITTNFPSATSGNTTFNDDFEKESIGLSQAYFKWKASDAASVTLGKQSNPFYMPAGTELVWDSDVNPEGATLGYASEMGSLDLEAVVGGYALSGPVNTANVLAAAQVGVGLKPSDDMGLRIGAAYYGYMRANTNLLDLNATLNLGMSGKNLAVVFDYVTNTEADADGSGWLAGLAYGEVKEAGDLAARYNYRNLETNALGYGSRFADSDFGGGNTGVKGHEIGVGYGLGKNFALDATALLAQGIDVDADANRYQLDFSVKF